MAVHLGDLEQNTNHIGALVTYFNKGRTPAKIVEIATTITRHRQPLTPGILFNQQPVPATAVESGRYDLRITSDMDFDFERRNQRDRPGQKPTDIYCLGRIVYLDGRGNRRETGFCRRLDALSERWLLVPESGYEYTY